MADPLFLFSLPGMAAREIPGAAAAADGGNEASETELTAGNARDGGGKGTNDVFLTGEQVFNKLAKEAGGRAQRLAVVVRASAGAEHHSNKAMLYSKTVDALHCTMVDAAGVSLPLMTETGGVFAGKPEPLLFGGQHSGVVWR